MIPKVSVVIATYNRPDYLRECLEAVYKQTFKDFEVIVVDDGSKTDYAEKLATEFFNEDKFHLRCICQKNQGAATARNSGAKIANGEIIAFTDDDCIPDKEWLEKGVRHFEDQTILAVEGLINKELKETTPTSCVTYTFKKGGYMTANMFYRKSVFDEVGGFDTNFKSFREDTDLGWRVEEKGKIVHEPESVVIHRVIDYSVWQFIKKHIKLRETYWDILLYKKHPEKFMESGEVLFGILTTHTMWIYLTAIPFAIFLAYLFTGHYHATVVASFSLLENYWFTVFMHSRMRSNIGLQDVFKHRKKFIGLFYLWWLVLVWDAIQRIKAIIKFRRVLL